ncbi:MAG: acetylxylan esterase, partial [Acidobacteria bacterium]
MKKVGALSVSLAVIILAVLAARTLGQESQAAPKPRYDEPNVVSYPLPDVLALPGGSTVKTAAEWQIGQRKRIFDLLQTQIYGRRIGSPDRVRFRLTATDPQAMEGKATLKQVIVTIAKGTRELQMPLVIFLPNRARKPVPLFLLINHRGPENTDPTRKVKSDFWPAEEVIARGYGIAAFQASDIDPDKYDGFKDGIHGLLETGERPDDAWGTIAAWGWGASWALDYFETDSDVDTHRVAVVGHSRGGKTALWAAARDERFAIAFSNCSGCAGAALSKRIFGETI